MINQEMLNYIRQAKASGKADEQIQTELRGAGWNEADLAEAWSALGGGSMAAGATAAAGVGFFTGKIVTVIIVVLLLAGGGIYFYFSRTETPVEVADTADTAAEFEDYSNEPAVETPTTSTETTGSTGSSTASSAENKTVPNSGTSTSVGEGNCSDFGSAGSSVVGTKVVYQSSLPSDFPYQSMPIFTGSKVVAYLQTSNPKMAGAPILCLSGNHVDEAVSFYQVTPLPNTGTIKSESIYMINGTMGISGLTAGTRAGITYDPRLNRTAIIIYTAKK